MPSYRPITIGSQVETLADERPGIVRGLVPDLGQAEVEFRDGARERLSLALIRRRYRTRRSRPLKTPRADPQIIFERRMADVIRKRMAELDWTFEHLVSRSGLSRSALWRMLNAEAPDPRLGSIEAVARALGVSPREFWSAARVVPKSQAGDP